MAQNFDIRQARLSIEVSQGRYESTVGNLRADTMTTLDVLQAQDASTQARLRYARAVVSYNQAPVNLLAALGLLSRDALLLPADG